MLQTIYYDLRDIKGQQKEVRDKINAAAKILREGGLVGIPTETVYGLAANGLDEGAVKRIFEAKGRPQDNPLILHLAGAQWLPRYCAEVPPLAYVLARKFWPGPLTMILKRKPEVPDVITAGLDTVAVRCPNHPVTLAIIREAGVPIAAPSANTSGRPSCTTAQDVMEDMDGKIQCMVDGGPCTVGVESTILDLTCDPPRLLRPGGLPMEQIEQLIGPVTIDKAVTGALAEGEQPKAPGMKYRHYAPKAPVIAVTGSPRATAQEILNRVGETSGVICFDEFAHLYEDRKIQTLGPVDDKQTQAQRVFDALRYFDSCGDVTEIYAQCPDNQGLGLAIANRLKKAAGFHVIEADSYHVVLGITGCTGAGKTSVLDVIQEMGGTVVDCDAVYHEMLNHDDDMRNTINAVFPGVFDADGKLNRQKLGQEVFAKKDRLDQLNDIVYSFVVPEVERRVGKEPGLYAIDAINLLESGMDRLCDRTIAVTAPLEVRVRRIMTRDNIPEQYARLRVSAQNSDEYYRSKCNYELNNATDSPEVFKTETREFIRRLLESIKEEKGRG